MADKPWLRIPSVKDTQTSPNEIARQVGRKTGRQMKVMGFQQFRQIMIDHGKTHPDLFQYAVLTYLFPRCIDAVLASEEVIAPGTDPLIFLVRTFPGCSDALVALYQTQPVIESPWNDALYDHIRMWNWTHCEICEGKELKRTGGVQ